MQNAQRMLHPCMIDTNALACPGRSEVFADGFLRTGLFLDIDDGRAQIVAAQPLGGEEALAGEDFVHVVGHAVEFLRAHDQIDARGFLEQAFARGSAPCSPGIRRPPRADHGAGR